MTRRMYRPRFGVDWRCFLLLYSTKLAFSLALAGRMTSHLVSSPLLQSDRGDRLLLLDGGRTLASLLAYPRMTLGHLASYAIAIALSAWVADNIVQAFTFRAMRPKSAPVRHLSTNLANVALQFGGLSLAYFMGVALVLYAFWSALGYVGALCLPLLGERMTDLTEVAFAGMTILVWLALRVTADQMRCRLAVHNQSFGSVFRDAPSLFGALRATQLARALVTLGIGYALPFVGPCLAPRLSTTMVSYGPAVSLALTELGSAAGIWLYLKWVSYVTCSTPYGARAQPLGIPR